MLMGSRRLSVTVFVICTSCLCLCSVLTYLLHPLPHFLSCPHFFLGACCWCCMSNSSPWDWEQNMQNVLPAACNSISTRYAQILFRNMLVLNCGDMLWYFVWCSVAAGLKVQTLFIDMLLLSELNVNNTRKLLLQSVTFISRLTGLD